MMGQAPLNIAGTQVQKHGAPSCRIAGTDMVGEIYAENSFSVDEHRVNPGNDLLFPRLSQIANVFEKYRFHKLVFKYFPIADATKTGSVVFAFETDYKDVSFSSKQEMLNHFNSRRVTPWSAMALPITGQDLKPRPQLFVRSESLARADSDVRLEDVGRLSVGTELASVTSPSPIGELWVDYDVEFLSPCMESGTSPGAADSIQLAAPANVVQTDTIDVANSLVVNHDTLNNNVIITDPSTSDVMVMFDGPFEGNIDAGMQVSGTTSFISPPLVRGVGTNPEDSRQVAIRSLDAAGDATTPWTSLPDSTWVKVANKISSSGSMFNPALSDLSSTDLLSRVTMWYSTLASGGIKNAFLEMFPDLTGLIPPSPLTLRSKPPSQKRLIAQLLRSGRLHNAGKPLCFRYRKQEYRTGNVDPASCAFLLGPSGSGITPALSESTAGLATKPGSSVAELCNQSVSGAEAKAVRSVVDSPLSSDRTLIDLTTGVIKAYYRDTGLPMSRTRASFLVLYSHTLPPPPETDHC